MTGPYNGIFKMQNSINDLFNIFKLYVTAYVMLNSMPVAICSEIIAV